MIEKKLIPNFPGRNISDIFRMLRKSFSNLKRFFWVVWTYMDIDYSYTLEILKVSLEGHLNALRNDSFEVDEDRLPRVARLERALELLNHKLEDNYAERCGYTLDYDIDFVELEENGEDGQKLFEIKSNATEERKKCNIKALVDAKELEKNEWREFTDIVHDDLDGWWC